MKTHDEKREFLISFLARGALCGFLPENLDFVKREDGGIDAVLGRKLFTISTEAVSECFPQWVLNQMSFAMRRW